GPTPVFGSGALHLERGGRRAEDEVPGEGAGCRGHAGAPFCGRAARSAGKDGAWSEREGGGAGRPADQPFTAPAMIPLTSCLPAKRNRASSGNADSNTPARTTEESTK